MKCFRLKYHLVLVFILIARGSHGQIDSLLFKFETGFTAGNGKNLPFWLQSNRYGVLSNDLNQLYGRFKVKDPINPESNISLSYGLSLTGRLNGNSDLYPEEWYGALKFYFLRVEAGSRRKAFREYDHSLGSGDIIWSGNSRPLPEISLSTYNYVDIPFTAGWLKFDAGISHGWMDDFPGIENVLLHHKWLNIKTGERFPLQLHAGLQHFAQWGGHSQSFGEMPVSIEIFWKVLIANGGHEDYPVNEQVNAIGNHLGSYNLGLDYDFPGFSVGAGWQTVFEDNSGRKLKNLPDGLYSLWIKKNDDKSIINQLRLEFLATDDQSGPRIVDSVNNTPPTGGDDYFRNYLYLMGWTSHLRTIGTPLITSPLYHSTEEDPGRIINNRVRAVHIGFSGDLGFMQYKFLYSHAVNKGRYGAEFEPYRRDNMFLLNFSKEDVLLKDSALHFDIGLDNGGFYGNNVGFMIRWIKNWRSGSGF